MSVPDIHSINWWHRITLPGGEVTPGQDNTPRKLKRIQMPENLRGKSVLDIGTFDGFFAFQAESRGADHVLAIDKWDVSESTTGRAGFDYAHRAFNSLVVPQQFDIEKKDLRTLGTFDVVFFLGVLYHLKNIVQVVEALAQITRELLIVETAIDCRWNHRPMASYYPILKPGVRDFRTGDPTTYWGPNEACVRGMLKDAGFSRFKTTFFTGPIYSIGSALKFRRLDALSYGRLAMHAYKG